MNKNIDIYRSNKSLGLNNLWLHNLNTKQDNKTIILKPLAYFKSLLYMLNENIVYLMGDYDHIAKYVNEPKNTSWPIIG